MRHCADLQTRLEIGIIDGAGIPAPWDDYLVEFYIGNKEGEIDRIKERGNTGGKTYSMGGKVAKADEARKILEKINAAKEVENARRDGL